MSFLENFFQGNLAIHQELINKFLKEAMGENRVIEGIKVSIAGGLLNLAIGLRAGGNMTIGVKLALSLGNFQFNRFNRFVELPLHGPVLISLPGIEIKAKLGADLDPDPAKHAGSPEALINLLHYLNIREEKITLDFNKMPAFNQVLQNKLGFVLKYLEITNLELGEEMIIIHPAVKFF